MGGVTQLADSWPETGLYDWDTLLDAARRLAETAGTTGAGPRYASEFGLALLELARVPALPTDERDLLYAHAEFWLTQPRGRAPEVVERLVRQLATYRYFRALPLTTLHELDRLVAVLDA